MLDALPSYLKPVVAFAYHTGWRKGEILGLTWDCVDLKEGSVRLESGQTKNKNARTIYLNTELKNLIKAQMVKRHLGCPCVFHRNGKRIKDFRGAWKTACQKAGLKGKLFHHRADLDPLVTRFPERFGEGIDRVVIQFPVGIHG